MKWPNYHPSFLLLLCRRIESFCAVGVGWFVTFYIIYDIYNFEMLKNCM